MNVENLHSFTLIAAFEAQRYFKAIEAVGISDVRKNVKRVGINAKQQQPRELYPKKIKVKLRNHPLL